jgi:uncharacterized protein
MAQRASGRIATQRFEWDELKNRANIGKHGFDFADAEDMFRGVLLVHPDVRNDYGEMRWIGVGTTRGRIAVVVFTERGSETIRVISLRKATRRERKEYEKAVEHQLEAG